MTPGTCSRNDFEVPVRWTTSAAARLAADRMSRAQADMIVRIAHECLVNAAKHAQPYAIELRLIVPRAGRILVTVMDDGVGIPPPNRRHERGIGTLRRRITSYGGTLRIFALETGTKVTAGFATDG